MTLRGYKQTPEHVAKRIQNGPDHPRWVGDAVSEKGGRSRAQRLYRQVGACTACGAERAERHHIDGNTANNETENIAILCRRCHMATDGRLSAVRAQMRRLQALGVQARHTIKPSACKRGHEYTPENTHVQQRDTGPIRICRACRNLHKKASRARKAAL